MSARQTFTAALQAYVALREDKPEEALRLSGRSTGVWSSLEIGVCAHHALGQDAPAREALETLVAKYASSAAYQIAVAQACLGGAFEWLERARARRDGGLEWVLNEPFLAGLEGDARWKPLLRSVNLRSE